MKEPTQTDAIGELKILVGALIWAAMHDPDFKFFPLVDFGFYCERHYYFGFRFEGGISFPTEWAEGRLLSDSNFLGDF